MDEGVDVLADDVSSWANVTERCSRGTSLGHNAGDSAGQGFYGTKPGGTRGVIDGCTALAILLVIQIKCDRLCQCELVERGGIWTRSCRRKVTSCTRNCLVRVRTLRRGMVYLPTRSKKKKAIVVRSAVARVSAS
jgi:hypothetical protein